LARRYRWRGLNPPSDNRVPWRQVAATGALDDRDAPPKPSVRTPAERRPVSAPPRSLLPRYATWQARVYLAFFNALPLSTSLSLVLLLAVLLAVLLATPLAFRPVQQHHSAAADAARSGWPAARAGRLTVEKREA
jgi:hypothetical protein